MKNILLLALFGAILVTGCGKSAESQSAGGNKKLLIALMPKSKGNAYFISCRKGAEKASSELEIGRASCREKV